MPKKPAPWGAIERLQVLLPAGTLKQLDALAESRLMSRAAIVREALVQYVKHHSGS